MEILKNLDFTLEVGEEVMVNLCTVLSVNVDKTNKDEMLESLIKYRENNIPKTTEKTKGTHLRVLKMLELDMNTPIEVLIEYCGVFDLKVEPIEHKTMLHALKEFRGDFDIKAGNGESKPNQELKDVKEKLENTEDEKTELEEEKEELEEKNEELQDKVDELEGEKKNTPAS